MFGTRGVAESYTRLIEFKVKDTDLNRAVNKLTKTLTRIDKTLVGIDKKLDHIAKQGFGIVAKEANKAERSVSKLGKTLKNLSSPQGLASGALGLLTGNIGGTKGEIARRVSELGAFDGALRKITNGSTGLPAFTKRVAEASTALGGFGLAHAGAITGIAAGGVAIVKGTELFYNLGKGVRQAEANLIDFIKTSQQVGLGKSLKSLFPKAASGSRLGGADSGGMAIDGKAMHQATQLTGQSSRIVLESLRSRGQALANNKKIQENLVALTGKHLQATVQVKKSQFQYNLELTKTRLVQAAVTADIWAAQKAWQGVIGTLKGAGNLIGGLFGGKLGGIGQAAGVIGLSRGIEALTGKLGFLNKAWIDNTNKIALWSARASEAITAVNIGYTALSKVLGAAQWTAGAITGFIKWEEQAMLSIRRINTARNNLDKRMAGLLDKGKNPLTGIGKWLRGESGERGVKAQLADKGESNQQRIAREIEVQQRLLKATNTTAKDYVQIQQEILKLQKQQIRETERRLAKEVEAGQFASKVYKDDYKDFKAQVDKKKKAVDKAAKDATKLEQQESRQRSQQQREAANNYEKLEKTKEARRRKRHKDALRAEKELANAAKRRQQQRRNQMGRIGENLMLGAGFPMLFGGGVGAVGGGVLGAGVQAATGSRGFGAQILFSAVGQQIDAFASKAVELGKALQDPTEALSQLTEMGIKVDESLKKQVETMVKAGKAYDAQILVSKEVAKVIGRDGVMALKNLGIANKELTTKANKLRIKIMSDLAPAFMVLIDLADRFIDSVAGQQTRSKAQEIAIKSGRGDLWTAAEKKATQAAMEVNPKSGLLDSLFEKVLGVTATDVTKGPTAEKYFEVLNQESKKILQQLAPGYLGIEGITSKPMGEGTDPGTGIDDKAGKILETQRISRLDTKDLGKQLELEKNRLTLTSEQIEIRSKEIEIARQQLEITWEQDKLNKLQAKSLKEALTEEEQIQVKNLGLKIENLNAQNDLNKAQLENARIMADPMQAAVIGLQKEMDKLNDLGYQVVQAATAIGSAFGESFKGIVSGSMTAQEALRNLFQRTADHFADMAAQMIAKQIAMKIVGIGLNFGGYGYGSNFHKALSGTTSLPTNVGSLGNNVFKAAGGPVTGGSPYIVGEKGPELFVPNSSGNIVPNHAMGGSTNVVVNVDASGSSVEGDEERAEQLGSMLAAAVQTEIMQQQRPGGLLAGTR